MKRNIAGFWLTVTLLFVLLLGACAPASTPSTTPIPAPPQATQPAAVKPPAPTSQDTALTQLINAGRKEGRVTVYAFALTGDLGIDLAKGFENRYNVKVDIVTGRGAEFVERVKTERRVGNITADLTEFSLVHSTNLKLAGATVSSIDIPVLQEKDVWLINPLNGDPEGHLLAYRTQIIGPYMNTNLVKPGEEPKSFKDFLNPKWEGKIIGPDPNFSGGSYQLLIPLLDDKKIDVDTIKALGQKAKFTTGTKQVAEALARGEYSLGLMTTDLDAGSYLAEGAPIKAIAIQEGIAALISTMSRINGGPHPNAAKLFMNWMLSPEGQTIYGSGAKVASVRKDVKDFRHPNSIVDVPLYGEDYKMAEKTGKLFADKYFVSLWKK
ncbi:MAG: extracellular solute-binding protein [Dehalococcoidia bacterium]|nr:extracellular solute-binding protein [Dehalococcoidia bacterium]